MNQKRIYEPSKDLALLREVSLELKNGSDSFVDYDPIKSRVKKSVDIAIRVVLRENKIDSSKIAAVE